MHISEVVVLNVGGQLYKTSLTTLRKDSNSLLATMFSEQHQLEKQGDGSYFIDRDGTHLRHVLNYLRNGELPKRVIEEIGDELLIEVKY